MGRRISQTRFKTDVIPAGDTFLTEGIVMYKIYADCELIPVPCSIAVCPLCDGNLSIRVKQFLPIVPGVNLYAPGEWFDLYCENQNQHPEIPISVALWKAILNWQKEEPFSIEFGVGQIEPSEPN
jgi:hypothetical protein